MPAKVRRCRRRMCLRGTMWSTSLDSILAVTDPTQVREVKNVQNAMEFLAEYEESSSLITISSSPYLY